jgi:hypothetical protein
MAEPDLGPLASRKVTVEVLLRAEEWWPVSTLALTRSSLAGEHWRTRDHELDGDLVAAYVAAGRAFRQAAKNLAEAVGIELDPTPLLLPDDWDPRREPMLADWPVPARPVFHDSTGRWRCGICRFPLEGLQWPCRRCGTEVADAD